MRTESNIEPSAVVVEEHGENAEIIFCENIIQETRERDGEHESIYTYDEYRLNVPNRENLLESVTAAKEEWLEAAKRSEYNALAAQIRARRDALLLESDARMCFDRMGLEVPSGSTFSAWLGFLKGIATSISGEWASYRQALRDLPEQPGFPYDVEFPAPPKDNDNTEGG